MGARIRLLVFYVNYGPYHLARARALLGMGEVDPVFLQLASSQRSHPWLQEQVEDVPVLTLFERRYEEVGWREASQKTLEVLRALRPDAVAVAGYGLSCMLTAAVWAAKNRRASVLLFETGRHDRKRNYFLEAFKRTLVVRLFDSAMVGGQVHRDYLAELGFPTDRMWEPLSVVDNAFFRDGVRKVRCEDRSAWAERLGLPERYFVFVGRLAEEKNVRMLLRAYEIYRSRNKDGWGLVLVGDGPLRRELEGLSEERKLPGLVLTGYLPTAATVPYYAWARAFVLPSSREPWGLVVNEAMACSLPVIVSDRCGCAPDLVTSANGWIFDSKDLLGLAEALEVAAATPPGVLEKMGAASAAQIARYTPERWAEGLMSAVRAAHARTGQSRSLGGGGIG